MMWWIINGCEDKDSNLRVNCWSCCVVMRQVCSDAISTENSIVKHVLEEGGSLEGFLFAY